MCPKEAVCGFLGAKSSNYSHFINSELDRSEFVGEDPNQLVRFLKLHNRCSGAYLQMYYDVVDAKGKSNSPLVDLRVQPDSFGSRIRILSQKFGKYLCFNKRKRITSRYNGKSQKCVFVERMSPNHFTEFESAWKPGVFLGFNRRGRFLSPDRYSAKRHCFQFIKVEKQIPREEEEEEEEEDDDEDGEEDLHGNSNSYSKFVSEQKVGGEGQENFWSSILTDSILKRLRAGSNASDERTVVDAVPEHQYRHRHQSSIRRNVR